ncbi:hypothetical protein MMC07_003245 [Pseudocyphellaria aurata]|nr:hypothetical protein [Pseudocyphellaria aurata]
MTDPLQEPALDTPPGAISQFPTIHSDEQKWFYVCAVLSSVVPGILLILRMYTKIWIVRKVDLTDYLIVTAFLMFMVFLACARKCFAEGAGVHQWNLPMHNFISMYYWFYIAQILYAPTLFPVKTALLLQYIRLFAPTRSFNRFLWYTATSTIAITAIYYTISTFVTTFLCSPREAYWNPLLSQDKCLNNGLLVIITRIYNIISDIIILLLPVRAVWKLRIPIKRKAGIVLLFAIGMLACIANAMIIYYVAITSIGVEKVDASYNIAAAGMWALAEISFGMIVTCTFSLPKFIEAEGTRIRGILSSLTRPYVSPTFFVFFSKKDTVDSPDLTLDRVSASGYSESNIAFAGNHDQTIEGDLSEEGVQSSAKYPSVDIPNSLNGV